MRIILLGPPGAGKGTQAQFISQQWAIPLIATGDMLRAAVKAQSAVGLEVAKIIHSGALVPDDLMIRLVEERIARADCQTGFLLDGFPRTLLQAEALRQVVSISHVVELVIADAVIVARMAGRLTHPASGRVYHTVNHPPQVAGHDDLTGEPLVIREDDQEATVRKRLAIYHEQTEPLAAYYRDWAATEQANAPRYLAVNAEESVAMVSQQLMAWLRGS